MKISINAPSVPTANIAVNKSRIKLYDNVGEMPTYYLQKGTTFQIELFNPTTNVILAKIALNGNLISQGGLVLNQGQRVFLDRYLDVAKKFLFDTYEVENSEEVKAAIKNNGDFKVEFYREATILNSYTNINHIRRSRLENPYDSRKLYKGNVTCYNSNVSGSLNTSYTSDSTQHCCEVNPTNFLDSLSLDLHIPIRDTTLSRSKSIETGRVEQGSHSNQEIKTVNKTFEIYAFHTIECKMLPVSQKINTVDDIQVKVYCTNCAHKLKKEYKYCPVCATKV